MLSELNVCFEFSASYLCCRSPIKHVRRHSWEKNYSWEKNFIKNSECFSSAGTRNSFLVKTRCSFVNSSYLDLRAWNKNRINVPSMLFQRENKFRTAAPAFPLSRSENKLIYG